MTVFVNATVVMIVMLRIMVMMMFMVMVIVIKMVMVMDTWVIEPSVLLNVGGLVGGQSESSLHPILPSSVSW